MKTNSTMAIDPVNLLTNRFDVAATAVVFGMAGAAVGWIAWGGGTEVWRLSWLLLLPVGWGIARSRWSASLLMLGYYLGGARGLPGGTAVFFGESSPWWVGWACWLGACVLLALPFMVLWSAQALGRGCRFVLSAGVSVVPPLALIGWINPLMVAGAVFPGLGWAGLALTGFLLTTLATRRWRATVGLGVIALSANGWSAAHAVQVPDDWQGVDTHFSRLGSGGSGDAIALLAAMERVRWVKSFAASVPANSVRILPETVLGPYGRMAKFSLVDTEAGLAARGARILVGTELLLQGGRYLNAAMVLGAAPGEGRSAVQNIPVPISMWKPWASNGAVADIFGHEGVIEVQGQRAGVMICYEQLLAFSGFWMMLERPTVLVGMSNLWWVKDKSIPVIQSQMMGSFSRLFGIGVVRAVNS